mgnify:CR=1 FL=1
MGDMSILEVKNVSKHFSIKRGFLRKSTETVQAVRNVSFRIGYGESYGVVGESGSGKTTLARVVLRLIDPTEGDILFEDTNLAKLDPETLRQLRRDMQMIFQDPHSSLNPRKKILQSVGEPLVIHERLGGRDLSQRVRELLEVVFQTADQMKADLFGERRFAKALEGRIMASLFYEPSTRTRFYFESAMLRLCGSVITTENAREFSSAAKGESLSDSTRIMNGYADVIVMRHNEAGSAARAAGFAEAIYLDPAEHRYLEEIGAANFLGLKGDALITPKELKGLMDAKDPKLVLISVVKGGLTGSFTRGHIPGAFQFTPYQSLGIDQMLANIPTDHPIVVYGWTGQHSSQLVAYLNMLGYEAYSLVFGANALFCDGHVRFLEDRADSAQIRALTTIAGGEDD